MLLKQLKTEVKKVNVKRKHTSSIQSLHISTGYRKAQGSYDTQLQIKHNEKTEMEISHLKSGINTSFWVPCH